MFGLPVKFEMADMLRADLADARQAWLDAAGDADEYQRREQSDFLSEVNHDGQALDFHALRHTCGAWAAMAGASPKAVQALMRHSTITLTMDTYGHLFPGQEAETVARFPRMLTGEHLQQFLQQSECPAMPAGATGCEPGDRSPGKAKPRKPVRIAGLRGSVRLNATHGESAPTWTRTKNLLIKSQLLYQLSYRGMSAALAFAASPGQPFPGWVF